MCQGVESVAEFDAVVVCNGHYSEPRVPELPGGRQFRGKQLHTHNFRENGPFQGLRVVIMGASASGQDIAREIAEVADKVKLPNARMNLLWWFPSSKAVVKDVHFL